MRSLSWFILLLISLLISPVIAVDTSNWVNITTNSNISFEIPPTWAWDPMDQSSVAIRTEKSDAVLMISYIPSIPPLPQISEADLVNKVKKELAELHVPNASEVNYDNGTVNITGTSLDGIIINYREKYENDHFSHWISEYSDNDAVIKYQDTILAIIGNSSFNSTPIKG